MNILTKFQQKSLDKPNEKLERILEIQDLIDSLCITKSLTPVLIERWERLSEFPYLHDGGIHWRKYSLRQTQTKIALTLVDDLTWKQLESERGKALVAEVYALGVQFLFAVVGYNGHSSPKIDDLSVYIHRNKEDFDKMPFSF